MKIKYWLMLLGITIVILSLVKEVTINIPGKEIPKTDTDTLSIRVSNSYPTMCPGCGGVNKIIINYPKKIKRNESKEISVELISSGRESFAESDMMRMRNDRTDTINHDLILKLFSSAFDISPNEEIKKQKGSPFPLIWSWIISPKKEGTQYAILDFSDLDFHSYKEKILQRESGGAEISASILINGIEVKSTTIKDFIKQDLKIEVLTIEGIGITSFTYIKYFLLLIGSLLMYPAISEIVQEKFLKKYTEKQSK